MGIVIGACLLASCSSGASADRQAAANPSTTATSTITQTGASGGTIWLAATTTCAPGSSPHCSSVGDGSVDTDPAKFVAVKVTSAAVDDADPAGRSVAVVLDGNGSALLASASSSVASAGPNGRLAIKVADRVISAVQVAAPVTSPQVVIAVPDSMTAAQLVSAIRSG